MADEATSIHACKTIKFMLKQDTLCGSDSSANAWVVVGGGREGTALFGQGLGFDRRLAL